MILKPAETQKGQFIPKWKKKKVYESPADRLKYLQDIDQIVCWLVEKHDIVIDFDQDEENSYDPVSKIITINTRANYRSQLHTLLHEAGHLSLYKNKRNFRKRFPGADVTEVKKQTRSERVDTVREEVAAWDEGLEIAEENFLKISKVWYSRHRNEALYTYFEWACKKGKKV